MKGFVLRTLATAVAFLVLAFVFPQVKFTGGWLELLAIAIVFGIFNGFIKPIVKLLSFPVNMMTLGLFGLVINAVLLLGVAWVVDTMFNAGLTIGGFPTDGLSIGVFVDAFIASLILSVTQAVIGIVVKD